MVQVRRRPRQATAQLVPESRLVTAPVQRGPQRRFVAGPPAAAAPARPTGPSPQGAGAARQAQVDTTVRMGLSGVARARQRGGLQAIAEMLRGASSQRTPRFGFDQLAFDAAQFDIAIEHEIEGAVGQGRRFLGDAGDVPAGRQFDIAGFGVQFAGEQRKQAGFAAAVGADDADLPAGVQLNGGVDNQGVADAGEGDLAEGDHEGANYSGGLLKSFASVSYTHLRAHETVLDLVCRLLLEKKKKTA